MTRIKLKHGGRGRRKALLGADGAIMAAATLVGAGMTAAATASAAKQQAKAVTESANIQAQSIKDQTANNTNLQKESINFTRQQNQENRQQQQDIQTTLQMMAGQSNMNDRLEANKMQLKYGGKSKRRKLKSDVSYGGGSQPFKVTDGGGAIPLQTDENGYGVYELYGNDHEHYHKAPGGKNKTGVGIKFADGSVVEGEGNQNTSKGELMYVTPDDAIFISKHDIDGFNPAEAVKSGVHPVDAFNAQETLKNIKGLNDDGSRKPKNLGGYNVLNDVANITQNPNNGNAGVTGGVIYNISNNSKTTSPVARCGKRISLKRNKAKWGTYAGATYNALGNLGGAAVSTWGNMYAGKKLSQAYNQAGNILADAYSQMKGIDFNEVKKEDFDAPHTLAVIRDANTNINPQLERIRRNSNAETKEINSGTMSSAARQQRLAGTNDRMVQRMSEQYAYKQNADEQIKQGNAERITQTAQANADRDVQARKDWQSQRLAVLQYNNNIENAKLAGIAQARADAITQSASANATAFQSSMGAIGNALASSGQGFASAFDANRKEKTDFNSTYVGLGDADKVTAAILRAEQTGDRSYVNSLLRQYENATDPISKQHYDALNNWITLHTRRKSLKRGNITFAGNMINA